MLTVDAGAADAGPCDTVREEFADIKANVALYSKLTEKEIERAIPRKGFRNDFVFLIHVLGDDINDWMAKSAACPQVNQAAISEEEAVCGKQASAFLLKWKQDRTDKATTDLDRNRAIALGKILMIRRRNTCFVDLEAKLFR